VAAAAAEMSVSTETVYRMIRGGILPARHVGPAGRSIRIRRRDLWDYLDENEETDE
jgi:excisionase family DNA binding protein